MIPRRDFLKKVHFEDLSFTGLYPLSGLKFDCKSYLSEMVPQSDFLKKVEFKDLFKFLVSSQLN